jgi:hypothetical protein
MFDDCFGFILEQMNLSAINIRCVREKRGKLMFQFIDKVQLLDGF